MPRYQVTAEFSLGTEIEPQLRGMPFDHGEVEEYGDNSYFGSSSVTSDGGNIEFVVDAEDEENAERMAGDAIYEGMEVEDDAGFTWVVENLSIEVEAKEWEPTVEEALEVLDGFAQEYLDRGDGDHLGRIAKAATVVLTDYGRLSGRVVSLETRLQECDERITGLSRRLQEVEDQAAGRSTAPTA